MNCKDCGCPLNGPKSRKFCDECRVFRSAAARQNMRAQALGITGTFTADEWVNLCRQFGNLCLYCGSSNGLTPDHVVPLADKGTNDIRNIQPLCRSCNGIKNATTLDYRNETSVQRQSRWERLRKESLFQMLPPSDKVLAWRGHSGRDIQIAVFGNRFNVQAGYYSEQVTEIVPLSEELREQYAHVHVIATVGRVGVTAEQRDTLLAMQERIRQL
jgi:5-methylcytosine-specific restriction endonuclease McrA